MNDQIVLGIETSGTLCSVAWWQNGKTLLDYNQESPNLHGTLLAEVISRGFEQLKLRPENIALVSIASGPGSFTGLRIGMSYAKGFCFALSKPLIAVTNLEVLASQAPQDWQPVYTLIDARRENFYFGKFIPDRYRMKKPSLISYSELEKMKFENGFLITGPGISLKTLPSSLTTIEKSIGKFSAKVVCQLGDRKYRQGVREKLDRLEPIYVQRFAGVA